MALTIGTGPFGEHPAGQFDVEPPVRPLLFWEPFPKRLRVVAGGETIVDSRRVVALHQTGRMMQLCVPRADVKRESASAESFGQPPENAPTLHEHLVIDFDHVETWYMEEDLGYAHPRDPYHRVDVQRSSQHVTVRAGDTIIAESSSPALLFETSIAPRFYFSPDAVRTRLLEKSATVSQCPYKGDGQHWHVVVDGQRIADAGWSLSTPLGDALMIPRWFSFYDEKLKIEAAPS